MQLRIQTKKRTTLISATALIFFLLASILTPLSAHAAATGLGGLFVPSSGRILDTKTGVGGYSEPMEASTWRTVQVTGTAGIPNDGSVAAVSLNATVSGTDRYGTLFGRPSSSKTRTMMLVYNGNSGEYTSNTAILAVSASGTIDVQTESDARLILDVQGYYTKSATGTAPGGFVATPGARVVDTRSGLGAPKALIAPGESITVQMTGVAGVPSGASAVAINLLPINTTSSDGYLTPFATGAVRPSNALHYAPSTNTSIQAQVPLSANGRMTIYNGSSTANLVVDLQGYFTGGDASGAVFTPGTGRIFDSRGAGNSTLDGNETRTIQVAGRAGMPVVGVTAVVLTLTAIHTGGEGRAVLWPEGASRPATTSINFRDGEIRSNTVTVEVGSAGRINLMNIASATDYVIDVQGWYAPGGVRPPVATDPAATPVDIVSDLVAGAVDETSTATNDLAAMATRDGVDISLEANESVSTPQDLEGVEDREDYQPAVNVDFSVDYANEVGESTTEGLIPLGGLAASTAAVVQQTAMGVRVLTTITSRTAPTSYDYTFDVPATAELTQGEDGIFIEDEDGVYGTLEQPWAIDAAGNALPTSYTWANRVLTQHIDLTKATSFPVVADPSWKYTFSYNTGKTPSKVNSLLHGCFNCYFPVPGAPKKFPAKGSIIPLKVAGFNFECKMGGTATVGSDLFQYSFIATKNHIDGAGSTISFSFRKNKKLVVTAKIYNMLLSQSPAYIVGARGTWGTFASKLKKAE